ncbi:hypothetical protein ACIBXA_25475 [Micromonospora echinaurantiaca]|uniref:hypothetical protein n=1 Tax=Micromonospora echinaurantiaca TaxID=47857 RepID=UPI0037B0DACE
MRYRSTLIALATATTMVSTLLTPATASADPTPPVTVEDHGAIPLTAVTAAGAASGNMPDGSARTWTVVSGEPAYLAEIDPLTGNVIATYPLDGAGGAWGVEIAADGTVWVASYGKGNLYYLPYQAAAAVKAGQATPDASFLWQVDTDANGVAYTGTFEGFAGGSTLPGAHVVSYDKSTGQWRDYGTLGDQYTYVRSTAVVGDKVYAGTGTQAALFEIDIASGDKRQIPLPDGRADCQFTYELATSGTDLFVRFECTKKNIGYVYDTVTGSWKAGPWNDYLMQRVGRDSAGNTYLALLEGGGPVLHRYAPDGTLTNLGVKMGTKVGVVTSGGAEYVVGAYGKVLQYYNLTTGAHTELAPALQGTPVAPRSATLGPTGQVHVGGYFSGGFASYSPGQDTWTFDPRLGQAENLVTVGDRLYAGVYPGAKIFEVDPTRPLTNGNPAQVFDLTASGQDRPFAMADAGGLLAVGTVPGYGQLQSSLAIYDPATGKVDTYFDLVEDQSILTLTYADGILYGGTSIYGGNGIAPTQQHARVFAFSMATRELLWSREIVGHAQVTAVAVTSGSQVWAATNGTLLAFERNTGRQLYNKTVRAYDWGNFSGGTWQADTLSYNAADGYLYGSVGDNILRIKPVGQREIFVVPNARGNWLVLDGQRTYWVDGQHLKSIRWPVGN